MRDHVRLLAAVTLVALALAPGSASAVQGTITGVVVTQRQDSEGDNQLVISVPARLDGRAVDEIRVKLDGNVARRLVVAYIPQGWRSKADKNRLTLTGPALMTPLVAVAFDAGDVKLPAKCEIEIKSGGKGLYKIEMPVGRLPQVTAATTLDNLLIFPQAMVRGESVMFSPLSQSMTPVGGNWMVEGEATKWNGDMIKPTYTFTPSLSWELPMGLKYTDPWGETLVDAGLDVADVKLVNPGPGTGGKPAITGCAPKTLVGQSICVCGSFPTEESRTAISMNGQSLEEYLVSSSSTVLNFQLPPDLAPGPLNLVGQESAGYGASDTAGSQLIGVGGDVDKNKLLRGESTPLRLWMVGTDEPLSLRLWNTTPTIISLVGGEDQIVTTSGGSPNEVVKTVNAVSPGDFVLHYALTLSCPCAGVGTDVAGPTMVMDPPAGMSYASTTSRTPECAEDCEDLRLLALEAERRARMVRSTAQRAAENSDWYERQASQLDDEVGKDQAYLETLRRQAGEWRQLAADARAMADNNDRRNREQPGRGWDAEAAKDRQEATRRDGEAARLAQEAEALDGRTEGKETARDDLRKIADEAEAAAKEAERLAAEARAAYDACVAALPPECPVTVTDESLISTTEGGDDPRDVGEEEEPNYCGPDVTQAYLAALQRVYRRMQQVSDSDKGVYDGTKFLGRNGWGIDQWPNLGGQECPSGKCDSGGNSVGQYCYTLFGQCVPRHVLNDIMFGFTADLVEVPTAMQELGAHWAEAHYNLEDKANYPDSVEGYVKAAWRAADPRISQRSYEIGDEMAEEWSSGNPMSGTEIAAEIKGDWEGFLSELTSVYPWLADCVPCPGGGTFPGWFRDFSRDPWNLEDGSKLTYQR